ASLKSTASMRQPELSASSTSRAPSTPTAPDSVGNPPRRATRNSLSQRLSRLMSTADAPGARGERAALLGVAITRSVTNFIKKVTSGQVRPFASTSAFPPQVAQALLPVHGVGTSRNQTK